MSQEPEPLILIANPGSSSRKYAVYDSGLREQAHVHIEHDGDHLGTHVRNVSRGDI